MKPTPKERLWDSLFTRDERNSGSRARPAWPQQRVTKDSHVRSGSFTGRYERARRALRAKRRAALLGFPLPAAQRVDARYEKTYRAHGVEEQKWPLLLGGNYECK